MGKLLYTPESSIDIEDRLLAHLRIVIMNKLRRGESFMLQAPKPGGGKISIFIGPSMALAMQFYGGRPPQIDHDLIETMMKDASGSDGLILTARPITT